MAVLVEQHVRRLHVAMDVTRAMDRVQRIPERHRDLGRARGAQRPLAAHERAQIVPGHVAHHEKRLSVRDAGPVNGQHVWMLHRGGGPGLAQEPEARALVLDPLRRDDLDRHVPVEVELTRPVDDAHAAPPDRRLDATALELRPGDEHAHVRCIAESPAPRWGTERSAVAITTSVSYSRKLFAAPDT